MPTRRNSVKGHEGRSPGLLRLLFEARVATDGRRYEPEAATLRGSAAKKTIRINAPSHAKHSGVVHLLS